jgi:2-desacetyl-2-hydroxyethyl bacteriochlorophyllide A dehydrogenase
MKNSFVNFQAPYQVETLIKEISPPEPGELLVQVHSSAISPGTEMLVYRGLLPREMRKDESISSLQDNFAYPLQYGYACVGKVIQVGDSTLESWLGKRVFAFQPHQRYFLSDPSFVIPIPDGVTNEDALFFANLETGVNLVQDAAPVLGERGVLFGLGVVGLLTALILNQFPLTALTLVEPNRLRSSVAVKLGLNQVVAPEDIFSAEKYDFALEVSGSPQALQQAINVVGFEGRVIVGSWYGTKPVSLDLGSTFHRQRLRLISSQVSSISPALVNRWDKARRSVVVWQQLKQLQPRRLITHYVPVEKAASAYQLIDQQPDTCVQVVLTY